MPMNKLVIIGAGGHGKVIADIALKNGYTDICFVDDNATGECMGFSIIGVTPSVVGLNDGKTDFVIAIGNNAFNNCNSLASLDLRSFNTSNVANMGSMFFGCSSLTSLDLSSFDTSNVREMNGMFSICSSLLSLDVSLFDTSNVANMGWMFMLLTGRIIYA